MRNAGLEETQAGIKIAGRNINNLRYADDTTFMADSEEELKSLLMKVKESEKVGLNSTFRKLRSWHLLPSLHGQIDGETMEIVTDFLLGGSKITADGDGSHEIKRWLLLGRKVMTKLDRILKSRDITLPTKVCLVKTMVFPYKSWTIKKKLSAKELMLLNCGVGEGSWESLGLQADPTSPFWGRSALGFLWKEWC